MKLTLEKMCSNHYKVMAWETSLKISRETMIGNVQAVFDELSSPVSFKEVVLAIDTLPVTRIYPVCTPEIKFILNDKKITVK